MVRGIGRPKLNRPNTQPVFLARIFSYKAGCKSGTQPAPLVIQDNLPYWRFGDSDRGSTQRENLQITDFSYIVIPVVPHKAVAEVSKIGNL